MAPGIDVRVNPRAPHATTIGSLADRQIGSRRCQLVADAGGPRCGARGRIPRLPAAIRDDGSRVLELVFSSSKVRLGASPVECRRSHLVGLALVAVIG